MKIASHHAKCFDLANHSDIKSDLVAFAVPRSEGAVVVINGVESLSVGDRSKLDFLLGSTDSNSPFPNLAIILTWDTSVHPVPDTGHTKFVENYFAEAKVNARALVGRLKLIDLSTDHEALQSISREDVCASVMPPPVANPSSDFVKNSLTVVAVIVSVCLLFGSFLGGVGKPPLRSTEPQSRDEQATSERDSLDAQQHDDDLDSDRTTNAVNDDILATPTRKMPDRRWVAYGYLCSL